MVSSSAKMKKRLNRRRKQPSAKVEEKVSAFHGERLKPSSSLKVIDDSQKVSAYEPPVTEALSWRYLSSKIHSVFDRETKLFVRTRSIFVETCLKLFRIAINCFNIIPDEMIRHMIIYHPEEFKSMVSSIVLLVFSLTVGNLSDKAVLFFYEEIQAREFILWVVLDSLLTGLIKLAVDTWLDLVVYDGTQARIMKLQLLRMLTMLRLAVLRAYRFWLESLIIFHTYCNRLKRYIAVIY